MGYKKTLSIILAFIFVLTYSVASGGSREDIEAGLEADKKGNYDEALSLYSRVIAAGELRGGELASAYNNRGIIFRLQGNFNAAIADYTMAIKLKPDFANAYSNRGLAYAKNELYDQAIADFNKSLKIDPNNADAYLKRGNAYYDKGLYGLAAADYSEAIAIKRDFMRAYYNRCDAYVKKGFYDLARKDCQRALLLDPRLESPKKMLQWLDNGQKGEPPCMCGD